MGQHDDAAGRGDGHVALPVRAGLARDGFRNGDEQLHPPESADDDFSSLMASSMVATLLNTASSPVSPGQSSPPLDQAKNSSFVPPARPSSTPFPLPENRGTRVCCLDDSDYGSDIEMFNESSSSAAENTMTDASRATPFDESPAEVHEAILDHLFGYCSSPTSSCALRISSLTKCWSSALRHCRRRELANLALVNPVWRVLVQQRLYRHLKLKATVESIENAMMHLADKPHLSCHIKHIEVWFPVFQPTFGPLALSNTLALPTVTSDGLTNATYILPANNCTLDDVFRFASLALPCLQVLSLEGGERRKAPKVVYFRRQEDVLSGRALEAVPTVRALVTRGQWNLMRESGDFHTILGALPNLKEWQASYSKPKSKSYITISEFLPSLPMRITNLSLCLENDYRRETMMPTFYTKVATKTHICARMAEVTTRLEHFSYTGRICHRFFDMAGRLANPMATRLRSIDLTVKNCCRHSTSYHESGSGIQELGFIEAFERLVLSAVRSLDRFKQVEYLRIRFVDLDSILPPLNPYFLMANGECSGVWSDGIVAELSRVRPGVHFAELCESFGNISYGKDGRMMIMPEYPRTRISSLKLSNYRSLATRITIQ
ncbi:uncharacterized protein MAM_07591 [Metarhizium album ARSEF 1941]|uniref:Uncharacterized protein n=1 Tax=Metarhizium album (strain ARSEF 1941) TaxID=1081103 RepID=A0A0B2WF56_METAS|nr:uncharacterized protein MAM_07591 [Metarhizium album ARSEF 1941]KHN94536.1 hypothetical protein MAM_07591 [Metarhizium album ARSEF 1941]